MPKARLTRSETDRLLAGVCGGIADYMDVDVTLIRVALLMLIFAGGIAVPMYLILWFIMPTESSLKSGSAIVQDNFGEMGATMSDSLDRLGRPGTIGVVLVALGAFFLLSHIGINGTFLLPALLIGLGLYWLVRQNR